VWERSAFDDESFLLSAFEEDVRTVVYTDWLEHFDRSGRLLEKAVVVDGFDSAPVRLIATAGGALTAFIRDGLFVQAVDRDGRATAPRQSLAAGGPVYQLTLVPAPGGDVLVTWLELTRDSTFAVRFQVVGPDGAPRGPAGEAPGAYENGALAGVVEGGGSRAVLLASRSDGLATIPLTCAR
jgi:hypothetical protein